MLGRGQGAALAVGERRGRRHQGRDVIGAGAAVEHEALIVGEGAVLDRIDAGLERRIDAVDAMGVGGDAAAEGVSGLDDGAHLVRHHLPVEAARYVRKDAAGGGELDHLGAGRNLLAHRPAAIVGAVAGVGRALAGDLGEVAVEAVDAAMAAGDRDAAAGRDDGRAGELAGIDRVAQRGDGARLAAEVADRGEAGEQGAAGVEQGGIGLVLIIAARRLQPRLEAVVEAAEMDVHVDQAGEDIGVAQIDDAGAGQVDIAVADLGDAAAADDDARLAPRRPAGDASRVPAWMIVSASCCCAGGAGWPGQGGGRRGRARAAAPSRLASFMTVASLLMARTKARPEKG